MFVELSAFYSEKEAYNKRVEEIKEKITDPTLLTRNLEEERLKFKGITRKYLTPALGVIKEMFGIDYSLYKVGRDVDVNFKTIETTIHKTQTEIATEMNELVSKANGMSLDEYKAERLNIAISVIMSYVDDVAVVEDENKAFYLNHSKVVASSLELPVTKKEENQVVSAQPEIQYNPYANQPIELNNEYGVNQTSNPRSNEPLIDPFSSIYSNSGITSNNVLESNSVSSQVMTSSPVQQPEIVPIQVFKQTYEPPKQDNLFQMASLPQHNIQETTVTQTFQSTIPSQSFNQQVPVQNIVSEPVMQSFIQPESVQTMEPQSQTELDSNQLMQQLLMSQSNINSTNGSMLQAFNQHSQTNVQQTNDVSSVSEIVSRVQVVMPKDITFETKNIVVGKEKTTAVAQIISAILIPVLVAIASTILYFILNLDVVDEFTSKMPPAIVSMATLIVIATISLLLASPIIWIAKKRTSYIERFLIAPALLSFPIVYFAMELVAKIDIKNNEIAMHVVGILFITFMMYYIFVTLLFVRGFVNSANDSKVEAPKWNVFDKLGLILVIYTFVFTAIYETCIFIGVDLDFINKAYEVMYFTNNVTVSQYVDKLFMIVGPIVAALGMIMRTLHIFKTYKYEKN